MRDEIASKLEMAFGQYGFAEPSVPVLKKACGVSLRTLYKYYPSKDSMVVAALVHRHQRYLSLIKNSMSADGMTAANQLLDELGRWMAQQAPNGCMSTQAVAAFPENQQIRQVVQSHKQAIQHLFQQYFGDEQKGNAMFIIHEGVLTTWPTIGVDSVNIAKQLVKTVFGDTHE
ncbi:TetR/AcrR family transcriptional regulator [Vibrio coralliilyticus OCN008]|mgnify:CR=1 FL=1|uniref:TetR/AcrR family transcriptional regulator n=1 Tax=Vibrio TaxID=662 RepID=UPI0003910B18|nr:MULTISPECIES: TetR/AcrR family transcriptional regulator [Vibrio]ERB63503.1 hypothetical protein N779_20330 [Vibrio coralliilyticus OCN008]QIJ86543.1 TetR/AcrR family transcriptional regulator [Vibrio coralliilyticus OCN008]